MNYNRLKKANRVARELFKKYYRFYPEKYNPNIHGGFPNGIDGHFGALRKTKVFCSDPWCCGNSRKAEGPTVQEQKAPTVEEEW